MIYKIKTRDNKVYYVKQKDAVSLIKGDWFIKDFYNDYSRIYKVIDDKFQKRNGFDESILAEVYEIRSQDIFNRGPVKIVKKGTETFNKRDLDRIRTVFHSSEEAIQWLKRQLGLKKDSRMKDAYYHDYKIMFKANNKANALTIRNVKEMKRNDIDRAMYYLTDYGFENIDKNSIKIIEL